MPRQYGYPRGTFIGADEDTMGDEEQADSPFQFTQYAKRRQTPGFRQGARDPMARSRYTGMREQEQEVQRGIASPITIAKPTAAEKKKLLWEYNQSQHAKLQEEQEKVRKIGADTTGAPTGMSAAQAGAQGIVGSPFGMGTATEIGLSALDMANIGVTGANIGIGAVLSTVPATALTAIQHGRQVAALQGQVSAEALSDPAAVAAVQGQAPVSSLSPEQQAHVMDIQKGQQQARGVTGIKGTLSSIADILGIDTLAEMDQRGRGKGATTVTADDLAITESPQSLVADPITRGFSSADPDFAMNLELEELGLLNLDLGREGLAAPNIGRSTNRGRAEAHVIGPGIGPAGGPVGSVGSPAGGDPGDPPGSGGGGVGW